MSVFSYRLPCERLQFHEQRMHLTVAAHSADVSADPLTDGTAATPTDPFIVTDDSMGLTPGGKT